MTKFPCFLRERGWREAGVGSNATYSWQKRQLRSGPKPGRKAEALPYGTRRKNYMGVSIQLRRKTRSELDGCRRYAAASAPHMYVDG